MYMSVDQGSNSNKTIILIHNKLNHKDYDLLFWKWWRSKNEVIPEKEICDKFQLS